MKLVTVRYGGKTYKACSYKDGYILVGIPYGWLPGQHGAHSVRGAVPIEYHGEPCYFVYCTEVRKNKIYLGGE